jgi:dienelactone hydrolase
MKSGSVLVQGEGLGLHADLTLPDPSLGLVIFAHGSGSSRHSPRNRYVAEALNRLGLATLLADLLTADEERVDERTAEYRFDIDLLTHRVALLADWAARNEQTGGLNAGFFGASTGAAAALQAAVERPEVRAVVSRGGRPDLARRLELVRAPTLLIVGSYDHEVLRLNREALAQLRCEKELSVVPGATHLFEEPGTLDAVAELAGRWFARFLPGSARPSHPPGADA